MPEVTQAMQQGRLGPGPGWGRLGFAALLELPQASKKENDFLITFFQDFDIIFDRFQHFKREIRQNCVSDAME